MNPVQVLKAAYAALCARISDTSDRLERQNADRLKRLAAYDARYPKAGERHDVGGDRR